MSRALSFESIDALKREHSDTTDLIYMQLVSKELYLALANQRISFQRPQDPVVRTWEPIGGAMIPGTAVESTDFEAQGQEIQFVAIDPDAQFVPLFLRDRLFNRKFEQWRIHFHTVGPSAGQIRASYLYYGGRMNGSIEVEDVSEEDGAAPGTVIVTFRVMSPLSIVDIRRNIQTNLRSHQKWYPDDRGMDQVEKTQNRRLYFGFPKSED